MWTVIVKLGPISQNITASMNQYLAPWNDFQQWFVLFLGMFMASMFLIMPLMTVSAIAAESFSGERERKTMDPWWYLALDLIPPLSNFFTEMRVQYYHPCGESER